MLPLSHFVVGEVSGVVESEFESPQVQEIPSSIFVTPAAAFLSLGGVVGDNKPQIPGDKSSTNGVQ
jgi:hypothetical protein